MADENAVAVAAVRVWEQTGWVEGTGAGGRGRGRGREQLSANAMAEVASYIEALIGSGALPSSHTKSDVDFQEERGACRAVSCDVSCDVVRHTCMPCCDNTAHTCPLTQDSSLVDDIHLSVSSDVCKACRSGALYACPQPVFWCVFESVHIWELAKGPQTLANLTLTPLKCMSS